MRLVHVCLLGALAVSAAACNSRDTDGEPVIPDDLAGLRYISAVPDTSGLDFRVIDVVANAPNTYNATFRTGGAPYGVATALLPPHFAVAAGERHIRVFTNSVDPLISQSVVFDTTFDFVKGINYTVYLYGYSQQKEPAPGALTATTVNAAGNVNPGAHRYKVTFVTAAGETNGGVRSAPAVNSAVLGQTNLTGIPLGDVAVTQRKIYRTVANDTVNYLLLTTIANNTATTFTDNVADGALGAAIPTANTTALPRATPAVGTSCTSGRMCALILADTAPAAVGAQVHVRAINLIPPVAGAPSPATGVDLWLVPTATVAPYAGTATFANLAFGAVSNYVTSATSATLTLAATTTGSNTPDLFRAALPAGAAGTATVQPIAGTNVATTAITALLVPQSVRSSAAPQAFTTPSILYLIDRKPPLTAP